jgi:hypothetical protein
MEQLQIPQARSEPMRDLTPKGRISRLILLRATELERDPKLTARQWTQEEGAGRTKYPDLGKRRA